MTNTEVIVTSMFIGTSVPVRDGYWSGRLVLDYPHSLFLCRHQHETALAAFKCAAEELARDAGKYGRAGRSGGTNE